MDYDTTEIPTSYDLGRDHGPAVLELWMNVVSTYVSERVRTILDLGCGTGRFSEALAARFDADIIGIDPSSKMLERAGNKRLDPRVRYESGCGEAIPLPDDSVDLVFISMIYHHFDDPYQAAREIRRVLRDGGIAFLRAGTSERISSYPYVDFFPETRPILKRCLPTAASMRAVFEAAGFSTITSDVVTQEIAPNYNAYAEKLSAGADSVLIQLSPSEFEHGMTALQVHAASCDGVPVFEPIDVLVFR